MLSLAERQQQQASPFDGSDRVRACAERSQRSEPTGDSDQHLSARSCVWARPIRRAGGRTNWAEVGRPIQLNANQNQQQSFIGSRPTHLGRSACQNRPTRTSIEHRGLDGAKSAAFTFPLFHSSTSTPLTWLAILLSPAEPWPFIK